MKKTARVVGCHATGDAHTCWKPKLLVCLFRHSQMCGNAITTCHLLPPSDDVGILLGLPGQSHSSLKKLFDVLGKLSLIWQSRFKTTRLSQAAYRYDNSETPIIRTGVKAGKTAQEILEEYQPFKGAACGNHICSSSSTP